MRKLTLTLSVAALALAGSTVALADHHGGKKGPDGGGDGTVTLEEMTAKSGRMFEHMDANGDGVVDKADHEAHMAEKAQKRGEHHAKFFAKADSDGDGELSADELKAAHEARREKMESRRKEHGDAMFAKLDTDNSGGLSAEELAAGHKAHEGRKGKHAEMGEGGEHGKRGDHRGGMAMHMLKRADADGDKAVTRAEFDAAVAKHFAEVDTDKSGTITAEERAAAHEAMKARMKEHRSGN
jgi:Ca2+-binding EF-hand superfamily protein